MPQTADALVGEVADEEIAGRQRRDRGGLLVVAVVGVDELRRAERVQAGVERLHVHAAAAAMRRRLPGDGDRAVRGDRDRRVDLLGVEPADRLLGADRGAVRVDPLQVDPVAQAVVLRRAADDDGPAVGGRSDAAAARLGRPVVADPGVDPLLDIADQAGGRVVQVERDRLRSRVVGAVGRVVLERQRRGGLAGLRLERERPVAAEAERLVAGRAGDEHRLEGRVAGDPVVGEHAGDGVDGQWAAGKPVNQIVVGPGQRDAVAGELGDRLPLADLRGVAAGVGRGRVDRPASRDRGVDHAAHADLAGGVGRVDRAAEVNVRLGAGGERGRVGGEEVEDERLVRRPAVDEVDERAGVVADRVDRDRPVDQRVGAGVGVERVVGHPAAQADRRQ